MAAGLMASARSQGAVFIATKKVGAAIIVCIVLGITEMVLTAIKQHNGFVGKFKHHSLGASREVESL